MNQEGGVKFSGKRGIKQVEKLTSMVYFAGTKTDGEIVNSENMMGKFIHNLESNDNEILAFSNFGLFQLSESEALSNIKFLTASGGKSFFAGLSVDGDLYTWGNGQTGELGQGLLYQQLYSPMKIEIDDSFVAVSSGENHTIAVDNKGNAYGWGQNYDRQLGLYTKELEAMKSKSACIIEELVFAPRFLPFSLSLPIEKVSCGARFSLFLSRSGEVWSCGAGECGQLGSGRCTKSAVPKRVPIPTQLAVVDIAAGWGHALACTKSGEVFSWGFNRFGQLGTNDTATKHVPTQIGEIQLARVFAHGNSSAGLCPNGRLFSWGSSNNYRLMHGKDNGAHVTFPKIVEFLRDTIVQSFAFCKTGSAAMVLSRLTDLYPLSGPQKSFQQLEIRGCGFWASDDIVVKFSCIGGSGFAAPRSCPGWLQSPGIVACKPPRLGEAGKYEITVAMDGSTFLPDKLVVNAYKDFTITSLSPALIDRRTLDWVQFTAVIRGIADVGNDNTIAVRVLISSQPEPVDGKVEIIDMIGYFQEDDAGDNENASVADDSSANKTTNIETNTDKKNVVFDFYFDQTTSILPGEVAYINVQFTLNKIDYCPYLPGNRAVILHSFEPTSLLPNCFALETEESQDEEKREVAVCGSGFISTTGLPAGSRLEAVFKAKIGQTLSEICKPIECLQSDTIYLSPPSVPEFLAAGGITLDSNSYPTLLRTNVRFQLCCLSALAEQMIEKATKNSKSPSQLDPLSVIDMNDPAMSNIIPLSSKQLELQLYTPQPVKVSPIVCRDNSTSVITLVGTLRGGLKLKSAQVRVLMYNPDYDFEYLTDPGTARMIPIADAVTEDTFTVPLVMEDVSVTPNDSRPQTAVTDAEGASVTSVDTKKSKGTKQGKKKQQISEPPEEEFKVVLKLPQFPIFDDGTVITRIEQPNGELANPPVTTWFGLQTAFLSVLLDGQTPVPHTMSAQVVFVGTIVIKPLGKGPFAPGSALTLEVTGLVATSIDTDSDTNIVKCIVRFHAESNESTRAPCCDINCTASVSAGSITFNLPDANQFQGLETEAPAKGAKAKGPKNYFIGVSIDNGNTFDYSDKAILPVK